MPKPPVTKVMCQIPNDAFRAALDEAGVVILRWTVPADEFHANQGASLGELTLTTRLMPVSEQELLDTVMEIAERTPDKRSGPQRIKDIFEKYKADRKRENAEGNVFEIVRTEPRRTP